MTATIAYLVPDTGDAAVARRIALFKEAGATVRLAGFSRRPPPPEVHGAKVVDLGRTVDLDLKQRMRVVLRTLLSPGKARAIAREADVIVARNLEMLLIAARIRRSGQRLVYECLDIHRMMLGNGRAHRVLRALERGLLRRVDLVITSSPAFVAHYFHAMQEYAGPIRVVENKALAFDGAPPPPPPAPPAPPWRIGWLGMLRCARSLRMLNAIAEAGAGRTEVLIAGKPLDAELPDIAGQTAAMAHVDYRGAYVPADLPRLYGGLHFIWCVDYFEVGLNSAWLLPNRLYEGMVNGAVPLAEDGTEIADWMRREAVGVVFQDLAAELPAWLAALEDDTYAELRARVAALPRSLLTLTADEARAITAEVTAS